MKSGSTVLLVASAFMFGCAPSPRVSTVPEPIPGETVSTITPLSTRNTWTITPTADQHAYRSNISTVLELADSAGVKKDSVTSTTDFALSITENSEALSYSATIAALSLQGGTKTGTTAVTSQLPFSFTGRLHQSKLTISPISGRSTELSLDCSNEVLSATPAIQRAVITVPSMLQKDMTWSDSTTANICSGSIPVTSTTSRHFRVVGEVSRGILIERQERTSLTGEGAQGQHRLRIRSNGTGTAQLIIDARTGALLESTGTHTASVIVTASGKDQQFTQTTRERLIAR